MTDDDKMQADSSYAERMGLSPTNLSPEELHFYGLAVNGDLLSPYLRIRNAIIRIWHENFPARIMKLEDVMGVLAKPGSHPNIAVFVSYAFKYLDRYRFINYGVVGSDFIPVTASGTPIVICGAGIAGLSAAREIHNIFLNQKHTPHPKIMLLEARQRIGGRVLTFPLHCRWNDSKLFSASDLGPDLVDCIKY